MGEDPVYKFHMLAQLCKNKEIMLVSGEQSLGKQKINHFDTVL